MENYVKKAKFRNFQKHKKKVIVFSPGVTTLVGPTNAGKSTILRGLAHALLNYPNGTFFSHGKKSSSVEIILSDGTSIKRKRGYRTNLYQLNDTRPHKALGQGRVPPEIADLLRISTLNFQWQIDPPFWFTLSPGQVSKELNKLVNLDLMDRLLSSLQTEVRKTKVAYELLKERYIQSSKQVEVVRWIPAFDADFQSLLELERGFLSNRDYLRSAAFLVQSGIDCQSTIDRLSGAIVEGKKLVRIGRKCVQTRRRRETLEKLLKQAKVLESQQIAEVPDLSELIKVRDYADRFAENRRNLELLLKEALSAKEKVKCQRERLATLKEQFRRSARLIVCPTCGSTLKPKSAKVSRA